MFVVLLVVAYRSPSPLLKLCMICPRVARERRIHLDSSSSSNFTLLLLVVLLLGLFALPSMPLPAMCRGEKEKGSFSDPAKSTIYVSY